METRRLLLRSSCTHLGRLKTLNTMTLVLMKYFLTQTVYVDAPAVPTAVAETQTLKVIYSTAEIQTLVVRTQSASMLTEPEPEIEQADVMVQTEAEEPTPVGDANTQTLNVTITEKDVQTEKTAMISTHIQTEGTKNSHAQVQTDDVSKV